MIRKFLSSDFFRASAWLVIASFINGGCMTLVQAVAGKMESEYLLYVALLDLQGLIATPTLGVQTVLAHRMARADREHSPQLVASATRWLIGTITVLWVIAAIGFLLFRQTFLNAFEIRNIWALVFTLIAAFAGMITPIMSGIVQGQRNFKWFGIATMFNGVGRLAGVAIAVIGVGALATGAMAAVCIGSLCTLAILTWQARQIWQAPGSDSFDWRPLLKQILPISIMLGVATVMFTLDSVVVKNVFGSEDAYGRARMIGRTLVFATAPMVYVMFPHIVRSATRAEQTSVLGQTVLATLLAGTGGALLLTMFPALPLRILWGNAHVDGASLVPWFAWCMLPLAVGNVLINNLLARERYGAVPWLLAVAAGYGATLYFWHPTLLAVIQSLGIFGVLLNAVCIVFTLRQSSEPTASPPAK